MNKFNRRFFSFLLAFLMVLSPLVSLGARGLDISFVLEDTTDDVMIKVVGEKNEKASISIKNSDKYYFLDERNLDDKGILEFKVRLPKGDKYTLLVNVAGLKEEKIIDRKDSLEPGIPNPLVERAEISIEGYKGQILTGAYLVKEDDTVLSFTKRVLDDKKISYEDRNGYIASIDGQSEMDKGKNSGWVYRLNGKMPNEGAGSVRIKKGDVLVWKYTYDYIEDNGTNIVIKGKDELNKDLDSISSELDKGNIKDIDSLSKDLDQNLGQSLDKDLNTMKKAIDLSIKMNKIVGDDSKISKGNIVSIGKDDELVLTKEFVGILKDRKVDRLVVESKKVKLDLQVDSIDKGEDIRISVDKSDKLNLEIKNGKNPIDKLDKKIKLSWPIKNIKDGSNLRVKTKDGKILGGLYDENTKSMVFVTDEPGEFELEEGNIFFDDLKGHWAEKEIEGLANKGIVNGKNKNKFSPNTDISRGEFVALINRIMGYEKGLSENSFIDISKDDWYYQDISTVSSLGLVEGKDKNKFEPNSKITREEISTIVGRILEDEGYRKGQNKVSEKYKDREDISSWAKEGVEYLSEYDLLKGDSNNRLNPKANASRGEAGIILFRLYSLILFD